LIGQRTMAGQSKVKSMSKSLTGEEEKALKEGRCPDCDSKDKWQMGPSGGLCRNTRCGGCLSEFNVGPSPILVRG
jgi:hypothetical protein